jgi:hypothetical protein
MTSNTDVWVQLEGYITSPIVSVSCNPDSIRIQELARLVHQAFPELTTYSISPLRLFIHTYHDDVLCDYGDVVRAYLADNNSRRPLRVEVPNPPGIGFFLLLLICFESFHERRKYR